MFLHIATLNCDRCGDPFGRIVVSAIDDASAYNSLTTELDLAAQASGWFRYKDEITCDSCLLDSAYQQELSRKRRSPA